MRNVLATTGLATMLAFSAGAFAQGTQAVPAAPDPAKGGQASTQAAPAKRAAGNTANPTQRPDGTAPASRDAVKAEARAANRSDKNTLTPRGEASTMVNGQPNRDAQPTGAQSRSAVSAEARTQNRNDKNTLTPRGEASTMVNGQPNRQVNPQTGTAR